jgi:hypothetical protein
MVDVRRASGAPQVVGKRPAGREPSGGALLRPWGQPGTRGFRGRRQLAAWLTGQPQQLSAAQVHQLAAALVPRRLR